MPGRAVWTKKDEAMLLGYIIKDVRMQTIMRKLKRSDGSIVKKAAELKKTLEKKK